MDDSSIELNVGWWKKPSPFTSNGAWQAEDEEFPGDFSAQEGKPSQPQIVKCSGEDCAEQITIDGPAPNPTFTCRLHTPKAPESARFQATQFDRELKTRKKNSGM